MVVPENLKMKKLGIIAATYKDCFKHSFLDSILEQTSQNFDLHIYHDGPDDKDLKIAIYNGYFVLSNVYFHSTEERKNEYGHNLRDLGIQEQADKYEYLLITNCDNYYCPKFVEYALDRVERTNADVIYTDMVHSHRRSDSSSGSDYGFFNANFSHSMCDIGAFIVRSQLAKLVGFNSRCHDADGEFIEELKKENIKIEKISKILFVHN